jgi:hypothetical protein
MKLCPRCSVLKDDSEFYFRFNTLSSWCRDCSKKYDKEYRSRSKEYRTKDKCDLCRIQLGPDYIYKKIYTIKIDGVDRMFDKDCYDELMSINKYQRAKKFKWERERFIEYEQEENTPTTDIQETV